MTITLTEAQAQKIRLRLSALSGVLAFGDSDLAPFAAEAERTGNYAAYDEARFDYLEDVEALAEILCRQLKEAGL